MQVALKRIPDVARDLDNAHKVLREVCILRRVKHPHIVQLHDVFWKPSATGTIPAPQQVPSHMPTSSPHTCIWDASTCP